MHDLLEAILHLCEAMLPVEPGNPRRMWVRVIALIIAIVGMLALLALIAVTLLSGN